MIFISIDDNELYNLKSICDEIFGASCYVSDIAWQRTYSTRNDSKGIVNEVEHILVYSKEPEWNPNKLPRTAEMDAKYKIQTMIEPFGELITLLLPVQPPIRAWSTPSNIHSQEKCSIPVMVPAGGTSRIPCWKS